MADKYRVIKQAHEGYFPVGTIVELAVPKATPRSELGVYRDGSGVSWALLDDEVELIEGNAGLLQPNDVTVEAAGVKATFTGTDTSAGYIVGGVLLVVVVGIALLGRFNPDLFNIILK